MRTWCFGLKVSHASLIGFGAARLVFSCYTYPLRETELDNSLWFDVTYSRVPTGCCMLRGAF